jgi:DNA gyrase/topoisomerase IV subunit A
VPNFNEDLMEPTVLPASAPVLLIEGSFTIGSAGFNSSIPSHNLNDVISITIALIKNPNLDNTYIASHMLPDFSTGGVIYNPEDIYRFYSEGIHTAIKMGSKWYIDEKERTIHITELPYMVTANTLRQEIMAKYPKLRDIGIESILIKLYDDSFDFRIEYTKSTNPNKLIQLLESTTRMNNSIQLIMSCIINGHMVENPDIKVLFTEWISFRREVVKRSILQRIQKYLREDHVLQALIRLYDKLNEIIQRIRKSNDKNEIIEFLQKDYSCTILQAQAISNMKLYELSRKNKEEMTNRHEWLTKEVDNNRELLTTDKIDSIIISELESVKKEYGKKRRTELRYNYISPKEYEETFEADIIGCLYSDNQISFIKESGYLQNPKQKLLKAARGQSILQAFKYNTLNDVILALTNMGYVYQLNDITDYLIKSTSESKKWDTISVSNFPRADESIVSLSVISKEALNTGYGTFILTSGRNMMRRIPVNAIPSRINKTGCIVIRNSHEETPKSITYIAANDKNDVLLYGLISGHIHCYQHEQFPVSNRTTKGISASRSPLPITNFIIGKNKGLVYLLKADGTIEIMDIQDIPHRRNTMIPHKACSTGSLTQEYNKFIHIGFVYNKEKLLLFLKDGSVELITLPQKSGNVLSESNQLIKAVLA